MKSTLSVTGGSGTSNPGLDAYERMYSSRTMSLAASIQLGSHLMVLKYCSLWRGCST